MVAYAGFQKSVTFIQVAQPGDWFGEPDYNAARGYIVDPASAGQAIGTFCWGLLGTNNQQITPFKGSNTQLAGFVFRDQATVWSDASTPLGYSFTVPATRMCSVVQNGTFYAVAASLNGGGTIVAGDYVLVNNTTGVLVSQTSGTIPGGYTDTGYKVINPAPGEVSTDNPIANLVVISNVFTF